MGQLRFLNCKISRFQIVGVEFFSSYYPADVVAQSAGNLVGSLAALAYMKKWAKVLAESEAIKI